jgi:hypothetical protein
VPIPFVTPRAEGSQELSIPIGCYAVGKSTRYQCLFKTAKRFICSWSVTTVCDLSNEFQKYLHSAVWLQDCPRPSQKAVMLVATDDFPNQFRMQRVHVITLSSEKHVRPMWDASETRIRIGANGRIQVPSQAFQAEGLRNHTVQESHCLRETDWPVFVQ